MFCFITTMFTLLSVVVTGLPRFQTATPDVPFAQAVYPNLIVRTLQPECGTTGAGDPAYFGSQNNSFMINLDEGGLTLCVNYNTIVHIQVPTNFNLTSSSSEDFAYSGDKKQLVAMCNNKTLLLIDPRKRTLMQVGTDSCEEKPAWSKDERFLSYKTTDDQAEVWRTYDVEKKTFAPGQDPALPTVPETGLVFTEKSSEDLAICQGKTVGESFTGGFSLVTLRDATTGTDTLITCVRAQLSVDMTLDDGKIILLSNTDKTVQKGLHELLLFDPKSLDLTSIGLVNLPDEGVETAQYVFVPSKKALYFVQAKKGADGQIMKDCALVSEDLTTRQQTTIEPTRCNYPADLTYLPVSNELLYLQYAPANGTYAGSDTSPATLRQMDLKTGKTTAQETRGIQKIAAVSPNGERYVVILEDLAINHSVRQFDKPESSDDPHFLVYDSQTRETVYENSFGDRFYYGSEIEWHWSFEWARDGNGFLFDHYGDYYVSLPNALAVQLDHGSLKCTFEGTPECIRSYPIWSPGGRYLLVYTEEGLKVVRRSDNRVIPITKVLEGNDYFLKAEWSIDDKLIVDAFPRTYDPFVMSLKRWQVDPALAR